MIYIGIDPGLGGAVGVIDETALFPTNEFKVFDTPTMVVSGVKNKNVYNTAAMAALLQPYHDQVGCDVLVVLESVHSMPKQGVASSFSFGQGLGMWQGIIAALACHLRCHHLSDGRRKCWLTKARTKTHRGSKQFIFSHRLLHSSPVRRMTAGPRLCY